MIYEEDYPKIWARRRKSPTSLPVALDKRKASLKNERMLGELETHEDFMRMARQIAGLIKEIGSLPTPRQMEIHLNIDAKDMRRVCGSVRIEPYELLVKEARNILLREEQLIVGFGRMEKAPEDTPN